MAYIEVDGHLISAPEGTVYRDGSWVIPTEGLPLGPAHVFGQTLVGAAQHGHCGLALAGRIAPYPFATAENERLVEAHGRLCLIYRGDSAHGPGDPRRTHWFFHAAPWAGLRSPVGPFATADQAERAARGQA